MMQTFQLIKNGLSSNYLIIGILFYCLWPLSNHCEVVILILKHATTLRLSKEGKEALTKAGLDYQETNIDLQIQEYLKPFTPEDSVLKFADFIMATNIGLFLCVHLLQCYILSHLQLKQLHKDHF